MQSDPFSEKLFAYLWAQALSHPYVTLGFLVAVFLLVSSSWKIRYGETFQHPDIYRTGIIHGVLGIIVLFLTALGSGLIRLP